MDLKQVTVELRHGEPLRLFRPYEELYHSITGKDVPGKEIPLPGFELKIQEKRMKVVVDHRHTGVVLEDVPNIGYCIDNIMGVFRKITELVSLPPMVRIGARSQMFQESKLDFKQLVSKYKDILFKSNSIMENSTDVGASFTLMDGEYVVNLAFGPMELSQLKNMFVFEPDNLPSVVTFLDIDYSLVKRIEIDEKMLRVFINSGLRYADEQSKRLETILQKGN